MSVSVRIVAHAYAKLFSKYIAIMKKKVYNQPQTDVATLVTANLMQGLHVSTNNTDYPGTDIPEGA